MSKFASQTINSIVPYEPGEQPQDKTYIKLNTNENPFPPSNEAMRSITADIIQNLRRYNDPAARQATQTLAEFLNLKSENVLLTNGSDEALAFAFMCYGHNGLVFPDVTYGFYKNIAALLNIKYQQIPLNENFTVNICDYFNASKTVVLANPNAQTGIALSVNEIEEIVSNNPNNIVIVDQAYADFADCDATPLTKKYDNLLIVATFSKSRALAGARLGYAAAGKEIIADLNKAKYSFNPYNVNSVSQTLALNSVRDNDYFKYHIKQVIILRNYLIKQLTELGFNVLPSSANFVAVEFSGVSGERLYKLLKERGILVRHFSDKRIADFIRITVGTKDENDELIQALAQILKEIL